jgi:RimJ/RimL family protein N-acetyltransferase
MRCKLLPFKESDISSEYLEWLNNKELMCFSELRHRSHTKIECLEYVNSFKDGCNLFFNITDKETGLQLGTATAYIDAVNQTSDIGILIGHQLGRQGIGYECWVGLINFLFHTKDIRKITAGTMAKNTGMLKIFEKSNMKTEGIRKDQFKINNEYSDCILVAIFRDDFLKSKK